MANKSVLLVDDEPGFRQAVSYVLKQRGYEVIAVGDAQAALEYCSADSRSVSVVLADVCMPEMGGPELADEIGRQHPDLPVVLMSGYFAHRHTRANTPFIQKPFRTDELVRTLDSAMRTARPTQG